MKVVNLSLTDYSNFAYLNSLALQAAGMECESYVLYAHEFGYTKTSKVVSHMLMKELAEQAEVIQVFHSHTEVFNLVKDTGKRIFVYHTGTGYRQNASELNNIFNPVVERVFIDSPEFYTLGGKNVTYIATAIDTDAIPFTNVTNAPIIFVHYPSKSPVKGTDKIVKMMSAYPNLKFVCDTATVSHAENLQRMAACDVYIELFAPMQGSKKYGSFGVTAFEAAAMGKIVITNSLFNNVYAAYYGSSALCIANTEKQFMQQVEFISSLSGTQLRELKMATRQWIVEKHSLKATGEYWLKWV